MKEIGYLPHRECGYYGMYSSPFRKDRQASMKVDYSKNLFVDYGEENFGGTIIDLVMRVEKCTFPEAIQKLNQNTFFSFHRQELSIKQSKIKINKIKSLENIALLQYLQSRAIDIQIAQQHCKECYYSVANKNYFALAFENDKGGYELRNKYFKGCVGSKNISSINNVSDTLQIFEGFIDLLSFSTHYGQDVMLSFDTIVLNSLSCIEKAKPLFSSYKKIHLYLDNDDAGKNLAEQLLSEFPTVIDCSFLYKKHKDFNDFLISVRRTKRSEESHRRGYVSGSLKPCSIHPDGLENEY